VALGRRAVFLLAAWTDRIDGQIARSRGLITSFGKMADPIADKALTGGAFVALSVLGELEWWITLLVLGRELGITLLRFFVIRTASCRPAAAASSRRSCRPPPWSCTSCR
jgi:CDP-diacylglycerol--glycerol-3-phosphate 3-phosphatidyltransferase